MYKAEVLDVKLKFLL